MKRAIRRHHRKRRLASVERRVYAKVLGDRLNRMLANTNIWVRHEEPTSGKRSKKPSDYRADITYREQLAEVVMSPNCFQQENPYINHSTTQPKQGGFQMEFKDLFKPPHVPASISLETSLLDVLSYIKSKGHLALDIDFIDDYILTHTPENPDDIGVIDRHCLDMIEEFRNLAARKQEAEEIRWENAVNNPDHPDHQKEWDKLNGIGGANE